MKTRFLLAILFLVGLPTMLWAETLTLDDGKVSFESPEGFTQLTREEIELKYLMRRAPESVVGNETRGTTVAYKWGPEEIPEGVLPEVQKALTQMFDRIIPGIEWKKNEITTLNGTEWIYLEMTSRAIDTDIYNIMLVTSYKGRMLAFNFNSTKEEFPVYEKRLRDSLASVKIADAEE